MSGRVALVTGASKGIGAATAVALASGGRRIAVGFGRDVDGAEKTCASVEEAGGQPLRVEIHVDDSESVDRAFGRVEDAWGPVEILVNNAGFTADGLTARMGDEQWGSVLRTNLDGAFYSIRRALGGMMRARFGRIVNVSSVAALSGSPGQANYAASKAGVIGLTRAVAREMASRAITCNAVTPGPVDSDMTAALSDAQRDDLRSQVPLGRFGTTEEVAAAVAFLASDAASYVTGAVLAVDGGAGMGN